MITCPNCHHTLADGAKFCDSCGTPIPQVKLCPNCGRPIEVGAAFCQGCGASLKQEEAPPVPAPAPIPAPTPIPAPKSKKKFPAKAFLFGGIAVVAAVAVVAVCLFLPGIIKNKAQQANRTPRQNYAIYIKDGEILFSDLKVNSDGWQVTSRLADTDDIEDENLAQSSAYLSYATYVSNDGKYIFFPDKIGEDDDGINLYYREIGNPEAQAVKVDSVISVYAVNDAGTMVTYTKGADDNLYQYSLKEDVKDKIATDVENFEVSDDGSVIVYINGDDDLYVKRAGKDREKMASEIESLEYVSADFSTFYYVKDATLYKQTVGEDRVKLASNVYDVRRVYDSGEIFYLKNETDELSLKDYITDDMEDADATVTEPFGYQYPDKPVAPSYWDYDDYTEYYAAVEAYEEAYAEYEAERDRLDAAYEAARTAYQEKVARDNLRLQLSTAKLESTAYTLCYFDGTEEKVLSEAYAGSIYSSTVAMDAPVMVYEAYDRSSVEKVKISEIDDIDDAEMLVRKALNATCEQYVAVKGAATLIEQEKEAGYFCINSAGTMVYYVDNIPDEKSHGDLYRISITNGVVGKPELYDTDVYYGYLSLINDDQFYYFKDVKDSEGEMYLNKKRVDYDVQIGSVHTNVDMNQMCYFTDWNSDKRLGTLKVYRNDKAEKIADDVYQFCLVPDGRVLYLYDYSLTYYQGELREWNNGENRKLDDEVTALFPYYEGNQRGLFWSW